MNHPYSQIPDDSIQNNKDSNFNIIIKAFIVIFTFITIYLLIPYKSYDSRTVVISNNSIIPFEHISHPEMRSSLWGKVTKPYPTGAFWTNLVVKNGDGALGLYPYGIKTLKEGIQLSYGASRRIVTKTRISDIFVIDLQISSVEDYLHREVIEYDELSVTMEYTTVDFHHYKVFLVKCSPFITIYFNHTTPMISSPFMQIINVEIIATIDLDINGNLYILTLGNFEKWLVYSSHSNPLVWNKNSLYGSIPVDGYLRVSILPAQNYEKAYKSLLPYLSKYPIGGSISFSNDPSHTKQKNMFRKEQKQDQQKQSNEYMDNNSKSYTILTITYKTQGTSTSELLMLALPHQYDIMISPSRMIHEYDPIWCIKGKMKAMVGEVWKLQYLIEDIGWEYKIPNNKISFINNPKIMDIKKYLSKEVHEIIPTALDPYGFGKELSRMARLALIAQTLNDTESKLIALNHIKHAFHGWLENTNPNKLLYDITYGGIVTLNGIHDSMSDYGSGYYNDHHFHYGYFIYTAAIIIQLDKEMNNNSYFIDNKLYAIEAIVHDICNYNQKSNLFFPYVRHKDFYDGHSWASGLFQQGNGKGQESSSEAINAYYAAYLYGKATSNQELTQFANVMLSMEIHSTKYYWHMNSDITTTIVSNNHDKTSTSIISINSNSNSNSKNLIYDKLFASTKMVGNIGALDVTASTWFGDNPEYVHGINIMPVTPITEILFDKEYVKLEYPILFNQLQITTSDDEVDRTNKIDTNYPSDCSLNPLCKELGLQGQCCPVIIEDNKNYLECCDIIQKDTGKNNENSQKITDEWKNLIYMILAVGNKETAWNKVMKINQFGSGNSKANSLLWILTRDDEGITNFPHINEDNSQIDLIPITCNQNSRCDAIGMLGKCCPTELDNYLQCCPDQ